jgi:TonB family protein
MRRTKAEERTGRAFTLGFFMLIALLHLVLISVVNFFERKPFAETRELLLSLDIAGPELPLNAAQEIPTAPLMEELAREIPPPETEAEPVRAEASPVILAGEESEAAPADKPDAPVSGNRHTEAYSGPVRPERNALSEADYLALVMGRLEQNKVYPLAVRRRGIEGNITVAFTIKGDGKVSDIQLADTTGHRLLAQAAFQTIRSSSPFPVPENQNGDYTVQVTIRYQLEDQTGQNN